MTDEFAINILEQYREKPTLINEIKTVEEAVWLDEALDMAIKAIKQESVLDKISDEIYENYINDDLSYQCQCGLGLALNIIGKYVGEQE